MNVITATLELVGPTAGGPFGMPDASVDVLGSFGQDDSEEQDWQERALCAQTDPEAFFPEKGGSTREAKRICSGCEVRRRVPGVRAGPRRALRHLGRAVRARTPQAAARGLRRRASARTHDRPCGHRGPHGRSVPGAVHGVGFDVEVLRHLLHEHLVQQVGEVVATASRAPPADGGRARSAPATASRPGRPRRARAAPAARPTSASTPWPHTTSSGEVSSTSGTSSTARSRSASSLPQRSSIGSSASSTSASNFSARVRAAGVVLGYSNPRSPRPRRSRRRGERRRVRRAVVTGGSYGAPGVPSGARAPAHPTGVRVVHVAGRGRGAIVGDVLSVRRCSRTGCTELAVATLTYVYADSTAVVGPLATQAEPHSYDLCTQHAHRLTAPRGWEVVRFEGEFAPPQHSTRRPDRARRGGPRGGPGRPPGRGGARHRHRPARPSARAPGPARGLTGPVSPSTPDRVLARDRPVRDREGLRHPRCRRRAARRAHGAGHRGGDGAAGARGGRLRRSSVGYDMRDSSPALAAAFAEGVTGQGLDVVYIGLASTDMLYFASGTLGLPGAMFTASHNPARYNGIKLCRAGATPIGQDTGLAAIREAVEAGVPEGPGGGTVGERDLLADYAAYLASSSTSPAGAGCGSWSTPATAWAATPCPPCWAPSTARRRADVLRARRHVPQPRGQPARPGEPRRPAEARRRGGCRHRAGLRRRRRPLLRRRRARRAGEPERDHRAGRRARAGEVARLGRHPQPDHLPGRAGDRRRARRRARCAPGWATRSSSRRWPRPAPCSAASTRRTTTSATSGGPTPGCSPRCTCWPRSGEQDGTLSELMAAYDRYAASGEINSTVARPGRADRRGPGGLRGPRRRRVRRARRPHRRDWPTGRGSTCARPTPSRCCGSTSRRPTTPLSRRCATRCWPSSAPDRLTGRESHAVPGTAAPWQHRPRIRTPETRGGGSWPSSSTPS